MPSDNDILTIEEAANYLRMHSQTLREKVAKGEIPGKKIANKWVFSKRELLEWVEKKDGDEDAKLDR